MHSIHVLAELLVLAAKFEVYFVEVFVVVDQFVKTRLVEVPHLLL